MRSKNKDDIEEVNETDTDSKANDQLVSENNTKKKEAVNESLENSKNIILNIENEDSNSSVATEPLNTSKAEPRKRGNPGKASLNKKTTPKSTPAASTKKRRV
jgi:hypothetical protein